jgi:hypothetical protein
MRFEIRNPKAETRPAALARQRGEKKSEGQNPKYLNAIKHRLKPALTRGGGSDFGFRLSLGLRISALGL